MLLLALIARFGRTKGGTLVGLLLFFGSIAFLVYSYQHRFQNGCYIVPYGCIAGGWGLVFLSLTPPRVRSGYGTKARAAQTEEIEALTLPHEAAPGVCWQCGEHVRKGNRICTRCGATQRRPRTERYPPNVACRVVRRRPPCYNPLAVAGLASKHRRAPHSSAHGGQFRW